MTLPIPTSVEPGTYTALVSLLDPDTGERMGSPVTVRQLEVQPEREAVGVLEFGSFMRLLRYSVQRTEEEVVLILHWRALQPSTGDYKVFVHLVDPTSGARVAQRDVKPLDGRYPTRDWQAGEVIVDEIALTLQGVPPGTYRLVMGVYPARGGPRLELSEERGEGQPPDRFILPEVVEIR
jgi:hypothetical protein